MIVHGTKKDSFAPHNVTVHLADDILQPLQPRVDYSWETLHSNLSFEEAVTSVPLLAVKNPEIDPFGIDP